MLNLGEVGLVVDVQIVGHLLKLAVSAADADGAVGVVLREDEPEVGLSGLPNPGRVGLYIHPLLRGGVAGGDQPVGARHLHSLGGHVLLTAVVDTGHLLRPQANRGAGHVHGHVAAANDHHTLPGKVWQVVVSDAAQQFHG